MALEPSVVTVTGPDRSALLTDLTLRFGHIELISEREIVLPAGTRGHELTVRHRPFTSELGGALGAPPVAPSAVTVADDPEPADALELADVRGPEQADQVLAQARAEAAQLVAEAREQALQALDQGRVDADQLRADARQEAERVAASIEQDRERAVAAARAEGDRLVAEVREEAERARRAAAADEERRIQEAVARRVREAERENSGLRTAAEVEGRRLMQAAQEQCARELAEARAEARTITREARVQADALLREARAQADVATVEGRALADAVRDVQQRLRELGGQITTQLQVAQKDLSERTSLHSVQARLRADGREGTAAEIADHLARILRDGGTVDDDADPPG